VTATAAPERVEAPERPAPGRFDLFAVGLGASVAFLAGFFALRVTAWPPHEDETLALYVGRGSLGDLADTVLGERGGAPLHYVLAWIVAHVGGSIGGLRLVSALFAVASLPLLAMLVRRLTDRTTAALATGLAATSWVLLFHGVYARMYSVFLFTSLLSYLALLAALRAGGGRRWALWSGAILLCVATHPYGALVLASQAAFVLLVRERWREAVWAFAAVGVVGIPFWITDLVLAGRFDVGVGGGGAKLGGPLAVAKYLGAVATDFSAGPVLLPVVLALAFAGAWVLPRRARLFALAVFGVPALALVAARLGSSTAPETRHLIFALPVFAMLVAAALVAVARSGREGAPLAAGLTAALLLAAGVGWAAEKTPLLFTGEPEEGESGRAAAATWLAETGRVDDVLLGYEPVFLEAWERSETFSRFVLPRADARLAAEGLRDAGEPLGRGVWVLNAHDTTNVEQELAIPLRRPRFAAEFEARAFGPLLVIRTRRATRTADRYLEQAAAAMILGKLLEIGDADINFQTVSRIAELLDYEGSVREGA
jgi:hypothetical protein